MTSHASDKKPSRTTASSGKRSGKNPPTTESLAEKKTPARRATAAEVLRILQDPAKVYEELALDPTEAQLTFPTTGGGARIKVSMKPGSAKALPNLITFSLAKSTVSVPLVVDHDFQEYRLF